MFGFLAIEPRGHGPGVRGVAFPDLAFLNAKLWVVSQSVGWSMIVLATAGFAFAWWARIHLGRLWSGFVTRKAGHRIVDTGPYRLVRHPIYTGIDTAALALLVVKATPLAIAGFVLIVWGYWIKARIEERFLREELGTEAYNVYAQRVPMLVPFSPI
jgi:protein-S-isoprenylcysteine O-methyltransferase Ste14